MMDCFICDKKFQVFHHPEAGKAKLYAKTLTKLFRFVAHRSYRDQLLEGENEAIPFNDDDLQQKFAKISYCNHCLRHLRKVDNALKQFERLSNQILAYKIELVNQLILNCKYKDGIDKKPSNDNIQEGDDDGDPTFLRSDVIRCFNLSLREVPTIDSSEKLESDIQRNFAELVPSVFKKNLKVKLTRLEESPEYAGPLYKRKPAALISTPLIKEEPDPLYDAYDDDDTFVDSYVSVPSPEPEEDPFHIFAQGNQDLLGDDNTADPEYEPPSSRRRRSEIVSPAAKIKDTRKKHRKEKLGISKGKVYECTAENCGFTTNVLKTMHGHIGSVHKSESASFVIKPNLCVCDICGMRFSSWMGVGQHKQKAHSIQGHYCTRCAEIFTSYDDLLEHRKIHYENSEGAKTANEGQKIYACNFESCSYSCNIKKVIRLHLQEVHNSDADDFSIKPRLCNCEICGARYTSWAGVGQHKQRAHGIEGHSCTRCPEIFTDYKELRIHRKIHWESSELERGLDTSGQTNDKRTVHEKNSEANYTLDVKDCILKNKSNKHADAQSKIEHNLSTSAPATLATVHATQDTTNSADIQSDVDIGDEDEDPDYETEEDDEEDGPSTSKRRKPGLDVSFNEYEGPKVNVYECNSEDCSFSCNTKKAMRKHLEEVHNSDSDDFVVRPRVCTCDLCGFMFTSWAGVGQHKQRVHGIEGHACSRCPQTFPTDKALRLHRNTHLTETRAKTELTEYIVSTKGILAIPRGDYQSRRYACKFEGCLFETRIKRLAIMHAKSTHKGDLSLVSLKSPEKGCDLCNRKFFSWSVLSHHRSTKHGIKEYRCSKCGQAFQEEKDLKRHRSKVHPKGREFPCPKPGCSYVGKIRAHLAQHLAWHDRKVDHVCHICGLAFRNSQLLKYHQGSKHIELNLQDPNKYKCQECGKVFGAPPSLRNHIKVVHRNQFRFFCETCGKGVLTQSHLRRHVLQHTDERPHKCAVCHATFRSKSNYDSHIQRHTGEFRFTCQTCGKGFTNSNGFNRHQQMHSGVLKYFCEVCKKGFPVRNYLYTHMRSHETKEQREQRLANKKPEPPLGKLYNDLRRANKTSADIPLDPKLPVEEYPMHYDYRRDRSDHREKRLKKEAEAAAAANSGYSSSSEGTQLLDMNSILPDCVYGK